MLVIIFFYISNTFYRCYQKETPVKNKQISAKKHTSPVKNKQLSAKVHLDY